MSRLGQFIDVHVTRAQEVVALIVGVIALVSAIVGGVVFIQKRLAGPNGAPELSWAGALDSSAGENLWGPDRETYSAGSPPTAVRLNSITDQPGYGDERDFFRVRNASAGTDWTNKIELKREDEFEASIFFHNNSSEQAANYVYARAEMPAIVRTDEDDSNNLALAHLTASNAQPSAVNDSIRFVNNTDTDFALRYIAGTARIVSDSTVNGTALSDQSLFSEKDGVRLGSESLDGVLPPGASGRIVFRFVAVQPGFNFENRLRVAGTKEWKRDLEAQPGAQIEIQLGYFNTGDTEQRDVVLKARWPQGLHYIDGQTELVNSSTGQGGTRMGDGIHAGGVNIGHYGPGANAYLYSKATVAGPECSVLGLEAAVETNNGNRLAQSTVRVAGADCPES